MNDMEEKLLKQLRSMKAPNCPSLESLGDFLDGTGTAEVQQDIERHLRGCPLCINRLNELQELLHLAETAEEPSPTRIEEVRQVLFPQETKDNVLLVSASTSPLSRTRSIWETLREWLTPSSFGQWASLAAAALLALVIWNSVLREYVSSGGNLPLFLSTPESQPFPWIERLGSELVIPDQPQWQHEEGAKGPVNEEVYKNAAQKTVLVVSEKGLGSGAVIDVPGAQGQVLTNWHVIQGAERIVVAFKPEEGEQSSGPRGGYTARVVKADPTTDLALLQIDSPPSQLTGLSLGSLKEITPGQDAHAIGHPRGRTWTYTAGYISRAPAKMEWQSDGVKHSATIIQTQTPMNPGNSGGPLLNDSGELIGINSFIQADSEGLNFAVAVNTIKAFLDSPQPVTPPPPPSPPPPSYKLEQTTVNIVGVYTDAAAQLPSSWVVYRDAARTKLAYAVRALRTPTQIDTVIVPDDSPAKSFRYYFDTDCDGVVDLIGQASHSSSTIENYERPTQTIQLSSLAEEFIAAVHAQTLGHKELRVCQPPTQ